MMWGFSTPAHPLESSLSAIVLCDDYANTDRLATPPFGLRPVGHLVQLVGLGGLQFPRLLRQLRAVCEPGYDLVLLDFGTNDLAAGCSAELLADRVVAVAEPMLASYGVKRVVVMEVFPRAIGRYRCPPEFNSEARHFYISTTTRGWLLTGNSTLWMGSI